MIQLLRKCRKWLSTYVDGFYKEVLENKDGRFHPTIKSTGTISGRISSNLQQQPKDSLLDTNGNELFSPRKAFIPSGNGYSYLVFQDFDAMELRVQAHYTIMYGCLDENMCKMFIPYKCFNKITNEMFDYKNINHINTYNQKDENGKSVWVDNITKKEWEPIDPHGLNVKVAFGIDETHKDFKKLRQASKMINFASNYGSGLNGLLSNAMLEEYDQEIIKKIYYTYNNNFIGVKQYQKIVQNSINTYGYVANMYGRIYRVKESSSAYKCANYLVQGSCADLVKQCLINIDKFLKTNNLKSRVLYSIHDEVIWEVSDDEGWVIKYLEAILNKTAQWCSIPLTCGTDLSNTNWKQKKDIKEILG